MALQNEKKAAIRERYKGVDPSLLEVIPATAPETMAVEDRTLNVAAYIRVSTDNDEQTSSFKLQQNDFTERIQANPKWNFVGIYSDEGISGTELSHRKGMLQMLEDCRAGKIDYILPDGETRRSFYPGYGGGVAGGIQRLFHLPGAPGDHLPVGREPGNSVRS